MPSLTGYHFSVGGDIIIHSTHQEARYGNVHATGSTLLWVKGCRSLLRVVGIRSRILRQHSW